STDKFINLRLQKPEFNKDPNQVDIARVLVKDSVTGKVVQTQLRETDANSGIFEGQFQIYWANIKDVRPQIFILDAEGPDAEHESDIVVPDSSKRSPFVLQ